MSSSCEKAIYPEGYDYAFVFIKWNPTKLFTFKCAIQLKYAIGIINLKIILTYILYDIYFIFRILYH